MSRDFSYAEALEHAEHLKALGETTVYLRRDTEFPWDIAEGVQEGSHYRLNGPVSVWVIGRKNGLTFKWSLDFETRSADGSWGADFDRERLREAIMKMPKRARMAFADLLRTKVIPGLEKHTSEIREALRRQWDSEDAARGLAAFVESEVP